MYVTFSLTVDELYRILMPSASMNAFLPSLMLVMFLRQTNSPLRISMWRCRVSLRCQSRYSANKTGTWPPSTARRALVSACGSGRTAERALIKIILQLWAGMRRSMGKVKRKGKYSNCWGSGNLKSMMNDQLLFFLQREAEQKISQTDKGLKMMEVR